MNNSNTQFLRVKIGPLFSLKLKPFSFLAPQKRLHPRTYFLDRLWSIHCFCLL